MTCEETKLSLNAVGKHYLRTLCEKTRKDQKNELAMDECKFRTKAQYKYFEGLL